MLPQLLLEIALNPCIENGAQALKWLNGVCLLYTRGVASLRQTSTRHKQKNLSKKDNKHKRRFALIRSRSLRLFVYS